MFRRNRKGPSVYIKLKSNYIKLILKGAKIIEENKYLLLLYLYLMQSHIITTNII